MQPSEKSVLTSKQPNIFEKKNKSEKGQTVSWSRENRLLLTAWQPGGMAQCSILCGEGIRVGHGSQATQKWGTSEPAFKEPNTDQLSRIIWEWDLGINTAWNLARDKN